MSALPPATREWLAASGFTVADEGRWHEALTHGSTGETRHYQRLEFLGDRVLGLAIAGWLFELSGDEEGKLAQRLNALVSKRACAHVARRIGVPDHVRLGKQARDDGAADSENVLGDVMEALLGANHIDGGFDAIVLATGVHPRRIALEGIDHPKVLSYVDVLAGEAEVGERVAIIGAGGIGFDVAEFLAHEGPSTALDTDAFMAEWGVDQTFSHRGGLKAPVWPEPARHITLCQRTRGKLGAKLGKTTGWIHRTTLKHRAVEMLDMCQYLRVDDDGLHLTVHEQPRVLEVDHVVICAGQVPARDLCEGLDAAGVTYHLIGGADVAAELDAKRAIAQGTRLASEL